MDSRSLQFFQGFCAFSPDGIYFAHTNKQQIFIHLVSSGKQTHAFHCMAPVEHIEWSTDSELILTSYQVIGKLEVWSLKDKEWKCQISNGPLGLLLAQFAPDSRHVLTTSNLYLRLTIWSLSDQSVFHINMPKESKPGLDFSPGGIYMAVAEKRAARNFIGIYSCNPWASVTEIDTNTVDLTGLRWSPDASKIAVWDVTKSGTLKIFSVSGSKVTEVEIFGIHDVIWSPNGQLIAAASAGSKVQIIGHLTWSPIATMLHASKLQNQKCVIYSEISSQKYQIVSHQSMVLADVTGGGRLQLAISSNGRYLAVMDRTRPRLLWIWDFRNFLLNSVLIQLSAIKSFVWSPKEARLIVGCGTSVVYVWSPICCKILNLELIDKQSSLKVDHIECNNNGNHVLVSGNNLTTIFQI